MHKHEKIRRDRVKVHGPFETGHQNLADAWTLILRECWQANLPPIPTHVACLMLAQLKLLRAARPFKFSQDDYDDARNYIDFAQETHPKNKKRRAT